MSDEELLENMRGIIDELLKNSAHSFGIDFMRLNLTAIEVDKRLEHIHENGDSHRDV